MTATYVDAHSGIEVSGEVQGIRVKASSFSSGGRSSCLSIENVAKSLFRYTDTVGVPQGSIATQKRTLDFFVRSVAESREALAHDLTRLLADVYIRRGWLSDSFVYKPSMDTVNQFVSRYNGEGLTRLYHWMAGLVIAKEDAEHIIREAVMGALNGISRILLNNAKGETEFVLDAGRKDLLVGGLATHLGRLAPEDALALANIVVEEIQTEIGERVMYIDGAEIVGGEAGLRMMIGKRATLADMLSESGGSRVRVASL